MKFWKDAIAAPGQSQAVDFTDTPANELEWSEWYDIIYHFNVELVTFAILMIFVCYILLRTPAKFFVKFITILINGNSTSPSAAVSRSRIDPCHAP